MNPGVYDAIRRDELRTLYATLDDETKSMEQSDIILAHQINDGKTIQLLAIAARDRTESVNIMSLLEIAKRFPQFEYVRAAVRIHAGDLSARSGQKGAALATYRQVFSGPAGYARIAREKFRNLDKSKNVQKSLMHRQ